MFENRMLRRIFRPKRDEKAGEWRKRKYIRKNLSAFLTKYYSHDQIKKNEMGRACSTYGGKERCIQGLGGKI
jgi:hypothetical protein